MRNRDVVKTLACVAFVCGVCAALPFGLSRGSQAVAQTTITVTGDVNDYEAQKRSNTGEYIASENNANGARVGVQSNFNGSGTYAPGGITSVYFFQLPAVPNPGDTVGSATFSVGVLPEATTGLQPTFNADLYVLGVKNTIDKNAAEAQNLWYVGDTLQTALPTPIGGPVQRVVDNFLVPSDFIPAGQSQSASPKAASITAYVQDLYANAATYGFTPGTSYLAVRINPDAAPTSGTLRYTVGNMGTTTNPGPTSEGNRPKITIVFGNGACADVPAVLVSPAPVGATTVWVSNISPNAELIKVYDDGNVPTEVASVAGTPPTTPSVMQITTTALAAGTLVARQTVGGVESCAPTSTKTVGSCTSVPVVTIPSILEASAASITVTGVDPLASQVNLYSGSGTSPIASAAGSPPSTPSSVPVTVSSLTPGSVIKATQVINGQERCIPTSGSIVIGAASHTPASDSFGDGDRQNDGILDNPDGSSTGTPDPVADTGLKWYKLLISGQDVKVAPDVAAPGLGEDNCYNIHITDQDGCATANFPTVKLNQAGDGLILSMKVKFNVWPDQRDSFRFGVFKHNGLLSGDMGSTVEVIEDPGYMGTVNSGPTASARRVARCATASGGGGLFDLAETIESNVAPGITDTNVHDVKLTLVRTPDSSVIAELKIDGQSVASGEDTAANGGGGPNFEFNEVGFGGVAVSSAYQPYLDVSVDDIQITSSVNPCNDPVFDVLDALHPLGDGYVDAADFAVFQTCATGAGVPLAADSGYCKCMDTDKDNDLDMDDFGVFQLCYSGSAPASAACDN